MLIIIDYRSIAGIIHSLTKLGISIYDSNGKPNVQFQDNPVVSFERVSPVAEILREVKNFQQTDYLSYVDPARLSYVAVRLSTPADGAVIVGPFLTNSQTTDEISTIMIQNSFKISDRNQLEQFYQSLPILSPDQVTDVGVLLVNLFIKSPVDAQQGAQITRSIQPREKSVVAVNSEHRNQIEQNYLNEDKITHAIATGNEAAVNELNQTMGRLFESFSNRIPNKPLRSSKNICFVFNTICRIAAHKGGVHPVYLDDMSEKYALLIERQISMAGLHKLVNSMTEDYCQLVQSASTHGFSPIVRRAANHVLLNLGDPLSLSKTAQEIGVNASFLSRRFKDEIGITFTDYVNLKRVQQAKYYLSSQASTITDVALMTGFSTVNYFTKVFKKVTGETPKEFRMKTAVSHASK